MRCAAALLACVPLAAAAEAPPLRIYTTADGLVQNNVIRTARDSRGYLWFCTRDGLSRFDGKLFRNYGMADGLPHPTVTFLLETRTGAYWAATNGGGVARLDPPARPHAPVFTALPVGDSAPSNRVNVLLEDRAGALWAGTDGELYRLAAGAGAFSKVDLGLPPDHRWLVVLALAEDADGRLWIGTWDGLFVRDSSGRTLRFAVAPEATFDYVRGLARDRAGRMWIAHAGAGVLVVASHPKALTDLAPGAARPIRALGADLERWFTARDGLPDDDAQALHVTADGHVWVGGAAGLGEYDGKRWHALGKAQGIDAGALVSLAQDDSGAIWAASARGALRVSRGGWVRFGAADGLATGDVRAILEDAAGRLHVATRDAALARFDGARFVASRAALPADAGLEWPQAPFCDRDGRWWLPTTAGLFRLGALPAPQKIVGPAGASILGAWVDGRGDVWMSLASGDSRLARWSRAGGRLRIYGPADGVPDFLPPSSLAEDATGAVWLGGVDGGLLRQRGERFEAVPAGAGLPAGQVNALHRDARGRLWIATSGGGAAWIESPTAERLRIRTITQASGLASNDVTCVADGDAGRVLLGTPRGLDEFDPATGRVAHVTTDDGLVDDEVEAAFRDRSGALWVGTPRGLARLAAGPSRRAPLRPAVLTRVRVGGADVPLSDLGTPRIDGLRFGHAQNRVIVEFASVGTAGAAPRYEYRLEGADPAWIPAGPTRSVDFANLAPGAYTFLVRAVASDGAASEPAALAFTIAPPFWSRPWFLALIAAALGLAARAVYRYRVSHLLELAGVRSRIATDLHDDIGANLTRIAILSEVARAELGAGEEGPLGSIARISRESVAAMSDIVWAINPQRDRLVDLVRRMRQHAEELFAARGVALDFRAPPAGEAVRLGAHVRRDVYLIFKEATNNAARHSGCARMTIELDVNAERLTLAISDDGRGFDAAHDGDGQGLPSMRRRALALGGRLAVTTSPGGGTVVRAEIPLSSRRRHLPRQVGDRPPVSG